MGIEDQYMFGGYPGGPGLISHEEQEVYFQRSYPLEGCLTGRMYDGDQFIDADAPIDIIPLFIREGSDLSIH